MAIDDYSDFPDVTNDWKTRPHNWDLVVKTDGAMPGRLNYYLSFPAALRLEDKVHAEISKRFDDISIKQPVEISFKLRMRGDLPGEGSIRLTYWPDNGVHEEIKHTPTLHQWDQISGTLPAAELDPVTEIRIVLEYPIVEGDITFDIDDIHVVQQASSPK
ncbi:MULTISPECIES: hypothetical protein [Pseudomonas]|uniref:Uncharacterized protein n=2 Tax=Pseudomonas TaxID=286 RepID=A0A0D0RXB8_PSEFL|nr:MULTISPECIES: hypothetical protein [Pseudomonas fluorescens group]AZE59894.1 hypothetical protein C4K02_1517 [Pseudomonas synxantha]KIR24287.1 hypothetical protein PFLU3_01780 [Pseudomonas fluorescens]